MLSCNSAHRGDRWQSPGDTQGLSGPFLPSHCGDCMGKEFLQGLRQVSGCSSHGFGPRLKEAAGREGASACPPAPCPQIQVRSAPSGQESKPSVSGEMPARHNLMARPVASPIWGLIYGATRDGSSRQKLCRSRPVGHRHSPQQGANLMPSEPTQVLKAKCLKAR